MRKIKYKKERYTIDEENKTISDSFGNTLKYKGDTLPENNIALYAHDLFKEVHDSLDYFNTSINDEKMNEIKWEEF